MDLLVQLGVDSSFFVQLGAFLVAFVVLKFLLFKPYFAAFRQRKERTEGQTDLAERFISETRELEAKYVQRAQEANERFRNVFEKVRGEAVREYERLLNEARNKSKQMLDVARRAIQTEMETARKQLGQDVAPVSQLIVQKLVGKNL